MSTTILKLDNEYFTPEITKCFLEDLERACQNMNALRFEALFINYDLSFIDEYQEVLSLISMNASSWIKDGTKMKSMVKYDAKCIFCDFGKTVSAYEWTYMHLGAAAPMNRVVYKNKAAFVVEIIDGRLTEFGVCNGFTDKLK